MPPFSTKTDKPKDAKGTVRRIIKYILKYKALTATAVFLAVFSNIFSLLGPKLSGNAIDVIAEGEGLVNFNKVYYYAGLMILFYILSVIMSYVLSSVMIIIGRRIAKQMRTEVFDKLTRIPVGYYDTNQTGDIISRVSYDIDVINTSLSADVVQIVSSFITVVCSFAMMLYISPILVISTLVTIPFSIIYTRYMTRKTRPLFAKRSKKYGELNGFTEEMKKAL